MRTLIVHHLESVWEEGYRKKGTSFDELAEQVISHIRRAKYDRVILTQFENWKPQDEHINSGIAYYVSQWEDYGYGWCKEDRGDSDDEDGYWTRGGNHSEIVLLTDWMKELKDHNVSICGAFDGECIEDLEIALRACGVKFRRVENLIV